MQKIGRQLVWSGHGHGHGCDKAWAFRRRLDSRKSTFLWKHAFFCGKRHYFGIILATSWNCFGIIFASLLEFFLHYFIKILLEEVKRKIYEFMNYEILWCNSRLESIKFYEKNGFTVLGDKFTIRDIGLHFYIIK